MKKQIKCAEESVIGKLTISTVTDAVNALNDAQYQNSQLWSALVDLIEEIENREHEPQSTYQLMNTEAFLNAKKKIESD